MICCRQCGCIVSLTQHAHYRRVARTNTRQRARPLCLIAYYPALWNTDSVPLQYCGRGRGASRLIPQPVYPQPQLQLAAVSLDLP